MDEKIREGEGVYDDRCGMYGGWCTMGMSYKNILLNRTPTTVHRTPIILI
ncbi:MAG: hypothetical protein MI974_07135 [Chitinophagales bacterium]|nr:hypothetical protein [Chitinophagales bacterium]